ncbi:unnamed protein product [Owenia fusiformis]|uniref:CABIT domain-containing protein n=1 Tax=Owenia fusiformis TaxID=6347 RepID=A0A8J1TYE7_OWEFU|nr:unnamed protein product [Owenia fusiformis]
MEEEFTLKDFIECNKNLLPQRVKVTEGLLLNEGEIDVPAGTVCDIKEAHCLSVNLSKLGNGGEPLDKVSVPVNNPCKFKVIDDFNGGDRVYRTVKDLVVNCPFYVQCNKYWRSRDTNDEFYPGERMKLIRLTTYGPKVVLECKLIRQMKLVLLPFDCRGDFTVKSDDHFYTLADLVNTLPRSRILKLVHYDIINLKNRIPGIPHNYDGYLLMEQPRFEIGMTELDGDRFILPANTEINVRAKTGDYEGMYSAMYLSSYAHQNENKLPLQAKILDWDTMSTIEEIHNLQPGLVLTAYSLTTHRMKYLAKTCGTKGRDKRDSTNYVIIPASYMGTFRFGPSNKEITIDNLLPNQLPVNVKHIMGDDRFVDNIAEFPDELLTVEKCFQEHELFVSKFDETEAFNVPLRSTMQMYTFKKLEESDIDEYPSTSVKDSCPEIVNRESYMKLLENASAYHIHTSPSSSPVGKRPPPPPPPHTYDNSSRLSPRSPGHTDKDPVPMSPGHDSVDVEGTTSVWKFDNIDVPPPVPGSPGRHVSKRPALFPKPRLMSQSSSGDQSPPIGTVFPLNSTCTPSEGNCSPMSPNKPRTNPRPRFPSIKKPQPTFPPIPSVVLDKGPEPPPRVTSLPQTVSNKPKDGKIKRRVGTQEEYEDVQVEVLYTKD